MTWRLGPMARVFPAFLLVGWATAGLPAATRASALRGPELLEAVPGDAWLGPVPVVTVGYARPWLLPDLQLGWLDVGLGPGAPLRMGLQKLRAGAVEEEGLSLDGLASLAHMWLGAGLSADRLTVRGVATQSRLGGRLRCGFALGSGVVAGEWEGPVPRGPGAAPEPPARSTLLLRLEDSSWRAGVARRGSRYGDRPRWEMGLAVGARAASSIGLRLGRDGGSLQLRWLVGRFGVCLGVPVVGESATGLAAAVEGWP